MASTIWKGHLTFGLVSIPIKLFRAARAEKIHMHRLDRETGSRVKQVFVPVNPAPEPVEVSRPDPAPTGPSLVFSKNQPKQEQAAQRVPDAIPFHQPAPPKPNDAPISVPQMVQGFEFEKGKYVSFEKEELEQVAPKTSSDMQIVEFVKFAEVDPVYLESSYYVAPDKGGEKPYSLLCEALKKTGYAAIAEFVMHRRDQTMILRPGQEGIVAHTLFYEDEVKRENAFRPDANLVSGKEMELAVKLIEALSDKFDPSKFKDKYRERLQSAIAAKVESGTISQAPEAAKASPAIDIMAALKESLAKAKKPAASESSPAAATAAPAKKKRSAAH